MTHKRRNRTKGTVLSAPKCNSVDIKAQEIEEQCADSGNESPSADLPERWKDCLISYHRLEATKAWTFYQASVLERYHWFLDKKRRAIADDFAEGIAKACRQLSSSDFSARKLELEKIMIDALKQVELEERTANDIFRDNVERLEAGVPMAELPPVDSHVTLDQVSEFVMKYRATDEVVCSGDNGENLCSADREEEKSGSLPSPSSLPSPGSSEDSGFLIPNRSHVALSSLSEIWRPETDELASSFNTNSFYGSVADMEGETAVTHPGPALGMGDLLTCFQPSVADEDSAIQAVVYTPGVPHQLDTSVDSDTALFSSCNNSLLGLSSEYWSSADSFQQLAAPLSKDLIIPPQTHSVANEPGYAEDHPNEATSLLEDCMAVEQSRSMSLPRPTGCHVEERSKMRESNEDAKVKEHGNRKPKSGGPVKFTDCKTLNSTEKKLVEGISFVFSNDGNEGQSLETEADTSTPKVEVEGAKPISFAAAVLSTPKLKDQTVRNSGPPLEEDSKVLFSTKKPTRKFSESSSLNKTSICYVFEKTKHCSWGKDCIFAHGKKELRPFPKWFKVTSRSSEGQCRKTDDPSHPEPCANHFCSKRRQFLLRKTSVCKIWQNGSCTMSVEKCSYAHGSLDRKPLPKHELCRLHTNGKCSLKSSECVYAHSKSELRPHDNKKPKLTGKKVRIAERSAANDAGWLSASPSGRLRTISETSNTSNDSWSAVLRQERVRTVSGTSLYSDTSQGIRELEEFDWQAWDSHYQVPPDEELDVDTCWDTNECAICSNEFTEIYPRFALQCQHNNFHCKCITQWMVKDSTCPICRHPIDLADYKQ